MTTEKPTEDELKDFIKGQAIEALNSLKAEFENAASAVKNDKSLWPKRYSKSIRGSSLDASAERVGEIIDEINNPKKYEGRYPPLVELIELVSFEARCAASDAKKHFSRLKHDDKKKVAQFEDFDQKVKKITPLVLKAIELAFR